MTSADFPEALRHLVRIAAAVAGATPGVIRRVMTEAKEHVDPAQVDEVLLQSYLFAGLPRALNATTLWRDISGVAAPEHDAPTATGTLATWERDGDVACRTVYGRVYESLRRNIRALHPAFDQWMIVDGYGKVLSRPGLDLIQRELCVVAACAAAQQVPQLRSHVRGARNSGATRDQIAQTIAALTDVIPLEAMTMAREQLVGLKDL